MKVAYCTGITTTTTPTTTATEDYNNGNQCIPAGSPCWENYDLVGAGYCCNTDINNGVCPAYDPSETAYCPFGYEFTTTTTTDSGSGDASSGEQCIATGLLCWDPIDESFVGNGYCCAADSYCNVENPNEAAYCTSTYWSPTTTTTTTDSGNGDTSTCASVGARCMTAGSTTMTQCCTGSDCFPFGTAGDAYCVAQ